MKIAVEMAFGNSPIILQGMKFLEYFLYLIIFLIPAYLIRFSVFGIPTNALEVFVSILFLIWAATKCKNQKLKIKITIQNSKFLVFGIFFLLFGFIVGVFISPDTMKSMGAFKSLLLIPFLFFLVARDILSTEGKKEKALWALALSGIGVAVIAFIYWLFGILTFDGRLAAFYESPNMLAMYIMPSLFIIAMALISKAQFKSKNFVFYIVILIFDFCILILSRSLGAIVGVFTALFFYYLYTAFYDGRRKMRYILFFVLIAGGIALPFFSFFMNPWEMGRNSFASRAMVWQASLGILKDNWLFGIGPGMFQETYLAHQKNYPPYLEWAVPHPHNIFLEIWLYGGLAGLIGFLLILFQFFSNSANGKSLVIGHWSLVIMLYILIHGAVDNTLWRNDMAIICWLLAAIVISELLPRRITKTTRAFV